MYLTAAHSYDTYSTQNLCWCPRPHPCDPVDFLAASHFERTFCFNWSASVNTQTRTHFPVAWSAQLPGLHRHSFPPTLHPVALVRVISPWFSRLWIGLSHLWTFLIASFELQSCLAWVSGYHFREAESETTGRRHTAPFEGACCMKRFGLGGTLYKGYDSASILGLGTLGIEFYSTAQLGASLTLKDWSHQFDIAIRFPACKERILHLAFCQDLKHYYLN